MPFPQKVTNQQVAEAYKATGSVWKAAASLGICGQSVWERLRAMGHQLAGQRWTEEEVAALRVMAGHVTIGEIARRLGRPYAGVATRLSRLKLVRFAPRAKKIERGKGLNKATMRKLMTAAEADPRPITRFCRSRHLGVDTFILAAQKYEPARWLLYVTARSPLPQRTCEYCGGSFVPMSGKQKTCSRRCQADLRTDRTYYGGKRRSTIGLSEGICQLCARENVKGLSSHHVLGKENDPDNEYLIALCRGCHQLVGWLGRMALTLTESGWENLISLAVVRRLADVKDGRVGVHVAVDLEWLRREDLIEEEAGDEGASITIEEMRP